MTQALANVQYRPTDLDTNQLGEVLVASGFFPDTSKKAQAIVKVLAGRELGFGPIASMQGVYIIPPGRVTLSANLIGAAIQRSGKYTYRVVKELFTDTQCVIKFYERGQEIGESKFTMEDAKRAGLVKETGNYNKFPRNMLFSRALTNGARWYCPEVFNGPIYTPDELGAEIDAEGEVVTIPPAQVVNEQSGEVEIEENEYDLAIQRWVEATEQANKLGVIYRDLPDNPSLTLITRWTERLEHLVVEARDKQGAAA